MTKTKITPCITPSPAIRSWLSFSLLLLLSLSFSYSYAQETQYYLYVEALANSPRPLTEASSNALSTDESLNTYFSQYEVTQFVQSFPNAENPELASFYEIHANGNINGLRDKIQTEGFFGDLYLNDYPTIGGTSNVAHGCPSPIGINDTWIAQNWANNYALELIDAQCAWTITTGNNEEVAVIDTDIDATHPDLINQINTVVGPLSGDPNWHFHGTAVAGMVAAQTNNNEGIASIGNNTKIAFYRTHNVTLWQQIWQAYQDGVRIINVSWTGIGSYPNLLAVEEMIDNGTVLTLGAGNVNIPNLYHHSAYAHLDGAINVSGVQYDNEHGPTGHAHNPYIDLCAPSWNVTTTYDRVRQGQAYGGEWGTSFAAPQVAGTVALMRSVNPCLASAEVENMLKATCDPIADAASFPGLLGAGRLNAYEAVRLANASNATSLDLYIKDRNDDFGASGGYDWQATRDDSPDIWVRNQNDGLTNHDHEDPLYDANAPVYVYVRVRNKSCFASIAEENLRLYWSKASSWSSWPQNWDGTAPTVGDLIGTLTVPSLDPGEEVILEFTWNILDPEQFDNWATCLLARIEDSPTDQITVYPNRIDDDIYFNNNIAMKNVSVLLARPGGGPVVGPILASGRYMYIGNPNESNDKFDIYFSESSENPSEASLTQEAEVRIHTNQAGWDILLPYVQETEGIRVHSAEERTFMLTQPEVSLKNVAFGVNTRIPIYVGINFLMERAQSDYYTYQVQQFFRGSRQPLGGEYFQIHRSERPNFEAYAGEDQVIDSGSSTVLEARTINESAVYEWYNQSGELIHQGKKVTVAPTETTNYTLAVTTTADAYKDYDEVTVSVSSGTNAITDITPNPAGEEVVVSYQIEEGATTSAIIIVNQTTTAQKVYNVDPSSENLTINLSNFQAGIYVVNLSVNGAIMDSQTLIKQ